MAPSIAFALALTFLTVTPILLVFFGAEITLAATARGSDWGNGLVFYLCFSGSRHFSSLRASPRRTRSSSERTHSTRFFIRFLVRRFSLCCGSAPTRRALAARSFGEEGPCLFLPQTSGCLRFQTCG